MTAFDLTEAAGKEEIVGRKVPLKTTAIFTFEGEKVNEKYEKAADKEFCSIKRGDTVTVIEIDITSWAS